MHLVLPVFVGYTWGKLGTTWGRLGTKGLADSKNWRGGGGAVFIQASMSKIQELLKASPTVFKGLKLMTNTYQSVKFFFRNARLR